MKDFSGPDDGGRAGDRHRHTIRAKAWFVIQLKIISSSVVEEWSTPKVSDFSSVSSEKQDSKPLKINNLWNEPP